MSNLKTYQKILTFKLKVYDLLITPRDDEGNWLDETGNYLTQLVMPLGYKKELLGSQHSDGTYYAVISALYSDESKYEKNHGSFARENDFLCVDEQNKQWCIRRDTFLKFYQEVKQND